MPPRLRGSGSGRFETMKLIGSGASPFVRKVRVVLAETGQSVEEVPVVTTPLNTANEIWSANPLGKLPALVLDDGRGMYDSRVITRYLDSVGKGGLYPEDQIWDVLTLEALADGVTEAALAMVYEARFRGEGSNADWISAQWDKAMSGADALETLWADFLGGPVTAAHIAVGCSLGYLDFRLGDRNWRETRPNLSGWYETFQARPSMQDTLPKG